VVCVIAVVDFAMCMLSRHLRQESISAPSNFLTLMHHPMSSEYTQYPFSTFQIFPVSNLA
jgi:hypothetical protein